MCIRDRVSDSSKAQAKGIPVGIYKENGVAVKGNMITGTVSYTHLGTEESYFTGSWQGVPDFLDHGNSLERV